jgi:acetyl esterase/lipase
MTGFVEDRSVLTRAAAPPDETVRYGDLNEQIADVRYGKEAAIHHPLVILIHGGFWRPQFDRTHTGPMCAAIAAAGWTIVSIEYRCIPGTPDATVQDAALAIERLPPRINQHNGRVIAIGHSAGGHLVLWAAANCQSSQLSGALALGPVADLQYGYANAIGDNAVHAFIGGPASDRRDLDPTLLPSANIKVTIIHGAADMIAPFAMSENYRARHAFTRLVKLNECGHFAVIDPQSTAWPSVLTELRGLEP